MTNSRLVELLSALSKQEMKELALYAASPAVNKNEKVNKLFEYISSCSKPLRELTQREIGQAIFGKGKINNTYVRVVITGLVRVIEKYLVDKKLENDALRKNLYLLETFKDSKCRKSFNRHSREIKNKLEGNKEKDAAFYLKLAEYRTICYLNNEDPSHAGELLSEVNSYIDFSYYEFKLDVYFRMLVIDISGGVKPAYTAKIDVILKEIEKDLKHIKKNSISLYIKYLSVKMLLHNDNVNNPYYSKLKALNKKTLSENTKININQNLNYYLWSKS